MVLSLVSKHFNTQIVQQAFVVIYQFYVIDDLIPEFATPFDSACVDLVHLRHTVRPLPLIKQYDSFLRSVSCR